MNAMRERDDEHNVELPLLPSPSPEAEDSASAPPTSGEEDGAEAVRGRYQGRVWFVAAASRRLELR